MNIDPTIHSELILYVEQLGSDDQERVLGLARTLAQSPRRGTPGKELLRIVGTIEHSDLDKMQRVIDEEFGWRPSRFSGFAL